SRRRNNIRYPACPGKIKSLRGPSHSSSVAGDRQGSTPGSANRRSEGQVDDTTVVNTKASRTGNRASAGSEDLEIAADSNRRNRQEIPASVADRQLLNGSGKPDSLCCELERTPVQRGDSSISRSRQRYGLTTAWVSR